MGQVLLWWRGGGRSNVDERLEQFVATNDVVDIAEEIGDQSGDDLADRMDSVLVKRGFFAPTKARISKADIKLRVSEYIILVFASAIGVAVATYFIMNKNVVLAIIGAIVGLQIPGFIWVWRLLAG
ncbi:MAG: hypothetical protein M5U34_22065 [Chloroflexi bacterium]|nr:hypothetical protein [Chloroflexota bacterium]